MTLRCIFLAGLCLFLAGCSTSREKYASDGPLLPFPDEFAVVNDPDDGVFQNAVTEWLQYAGAPLQSRYEFTRIDLNNDGRRDGLVLLQSPHTSWCMEYGCTMMVFQAHNDGFSPLSEISPVRGPLVVSETKTNGWKDIVVRVSGRSGWEAKNVSLRFDGTSYPPQPAFEQALADGIEPAAGVKIFP